jgi:hypothetical protein
LIPLLEGENVFEWLKLLGAYLHRHTRFPLFLLLSNAKHDLESVLNGNLGLFGTQGLRLSGHTETLTAFRMTNDNPGAANILELVGSDLASVGTVAREVSTVLGSHLDIIAQGGKHHGEVKEGNTEDDVYIGGDRSGVIKDLDTLGIFRQETIALPVSSNQVTSSRVLIGRRRSLGASRGEFRGAILIRSYKRV